jgi:phage gpG-like protein
MAGFPDISNLRVGMTSRMEFQPSPAIIAAGLLKMADDVSSAKEPLTRAVKEVMIPSFQKNFSQGGRPAWAPLAEYTEQVRGASGPILIRSGRLERTMGQMSIWTITDAHAVIERLPAGVWYGHLHQAGNRKKSTLPARPFALIQQEDEEKIVEIFDEWLAERAARAGWS